MGAQGICAKCGGAEWKNSGCSSFSEADEFFFNEAGTTSFLLARLGRLDDEFCLSEAKQ